MKVTKVALFGHIPAGTLVWLTKTQARDRAHAVTEVESSKTVKDRKLYAAEQLLGFKAGEELSVEGDLDRGMEAMFGIKPEAPADKAAEKLAAAEAKVAGINKQIEAETAAVDAATDDESRAKAQGKLDKANAALVKAQADLDKLKV